MLHWYTHLAKKALPGVGNTKDLPYRAVGGEDKLVEVDPAVPVLVEGGEDEVGDGEAVLLQVVLSQPHQMLLCKVFQNPT